MKTIKDTANKYAESRYSRKAHPTADAYSAARNGFIAGYEFAQQWINVNDELPEENVYVLVMQDDSDYTDIAYLEDGEWYYSNNDLQLSFNPTHWRNI